MEGAAQEGVVVSERAGEIRQVTAEESVRRNYYKKIIEENEIRQVQKTVFQTS